MLLSDYLSLGSTFDVHGVFDPILDEDSHFFINLQRLKNTTVPEFLNSYEKIHEYFRKIIKLLDKAQKKDVSDTYYKQALKMFDFSEVNGICLGYAKGIHGAGFGCRLGSQVIGTAYDIVKAGISDPEFFELLPLFQEKVGADRLSDMIATLILDDIKAYTLRINREFGINKKNYESLCFRNQLLVNPYKNDSVLLVPIDILHKLPVAECWEDIDIVVAENSTLRAEMNYEVASEWQKYSTFERKSYLLKEVFTDSDVCKRVLAGYRSEEMDAFDPNKDFSYFLTKLIQRIDLGIDYTAKKHVLDSHTAATEILEFFKTWVENNKGWEIIWSVESSKREKMLQRVIHGQAQSYIKANHLDMSCEPDEGRGPVDFKVSLGSDISLIEVKLTTNSQYLHGYEVQLEEYGKAEQTNNLIYALIDLGNPGKVKKVQDCHDRRYNAGENPPDLIIIDGKPRNSASRA